MIVNKPRQFIPEAYLTAVRYRGTDKFSILDRKDFDGNIIDQIEDGIAFAEKHIEVAYEISGSAKRQDRRRFPLIAVREALINALIHRDYGFQNSCVFLNIFSDRLEIESPGGIPASRKPEEIEGRSVRRNPILADLLYRAGFGEKPGSGLVRIKEVLSENGNPPYSIAASNFFAMRMLPSIVKARGVSHTRRQLEILALLEAAGRPLSTPEIAAQVNTSTTTVTRELKDLIAKKEVSVVGAGRSVQYKI
jgi:predicted HTH transcriptional regulator